MSFSSKRSNHNATLIYSLKCSAFGVNTTINIFENYCQSRNTWSQDLYITYDAAGSYSFVRSLPVYDGNTTPCTCINSITFL